MARRILVVPVNHGAGVTAACLGLVHALENLHVPVGFCKPFAQARAFGEDHSTELFRLATSLRPPRPIAVEELEQGLAVGTLRGIMTRVVELTADMDVDSRVLVLEGLAPGVEQVYSDRMNIEISQALDTEVLLVGAAGELAPDRFAAQVAAAERLYVARGESRVVGVLINHIVDGADVGKYVAAIRARGLSVVGTIANRSDFAQCRVGDVVRALDLEVLSGGDLRRRISGVVIAAQAVPGFIPALAPGRLIIAPGDRHDVLLSAALAESSGMGLGGLLLTAGIHPHPDVLALVNPALASGLPLLLTPELTFPTATRINALDREIPGDDEERARLVMTGMAEGYDEAWLESLPHDDRPARTTPAQFQHRLLRRIRTGRTRIALTDGAEPRVLRALMTLQATETLRFTLVAPPAQIEATAASLGIDLPMGLTIIDPTRDTDSARQARARVEKETGISLDPADPLVRGLILLADGAVDGVVGGVHEDRARFLATVRTLVPLHRDETLSSSQAAMLPDEAVFFADALINAHPSADQLACIAAQTADTARLCGVVPQIAFVAPSSWSPTAGEDRETIKAAMGLLAERRPDLPSEGPLPFQQASRRSGVTVDESGNATVFVFPDISSATATAKAVGQTGGATVHPPLLQGLSKAVNLLPFDASEEGVVDIVVATAVRAADLG